MATAYTPGLTVTSRTTHRVRRLLPIPGDVLVKAGDEVDADGIMTAGKEGDLELRPHAICTGDKHRIPVFFESKEPAEPSDLCQYFRAKRGPHVGLNFFNEPISSVDINAGILIRDRHFGISFPSGCPSCRRVFSVVIRTS